MPHAVAALLTVALLVLGGRLLLRVPAVPEAAKAQERLQLRFVPRDRALPPPPAADAPLKVPLPAAASVAYPAAAAAPERAGAAPPVRPTGQALYDADGRVRLPQGTVDEPDVPAHAGTALLDRPNPVDYRGTRFEDAWVSDGDVAELTAQSIARGQRKVAELLMGKDIQHAQARPAPQVRFNPALHERPQDLGSEATGDAWRAAPVSAEPVPGLDGRASRSLREQVAQLERDFAGCPRAQMDALMVPVRRALDELQAAERALARGADPVRARHQLPGAANSAWDQARRGLWHARSKLAGCGG